MFNVAVYQLQWTDSFLAARIQLDWFCIHQIHIESQVGAGQAWNFNRSSTATGPNMEEKREYVSFVPFA